ncbi:FusB/FusC family EF-G-binding protein [Paenibacillus wenxiniae]|uniref:FusB/FusC family EF-G-binding protein n=1 Tax=Paenibacillus wenxiniae TaxID=1636843 RepID=A0ABW4RIE0_9BACL
MLKPFIYNHQRNVIQKQANFLLKTMRSVADRKVLATVRDTAVNHVVDAFGALTAEQYALLEQLSSYEAAHELQQYVDQLDRYVIPFPDVSPQQVQKLFPKAKKLKVPDLATIDLLHTTYLRWIDIATNRLYIVYPYEGTLVGIEGQITPMNKNGFCMFCHRNQELGFFNVKTKNGGSPDNFSSLGQYVCMDNDACNHNITNTVALERFIQSAGK